MLKLCSSCKLSWPGWSLNRSALIQLCTFTHRLQQYIRKLTSPFVPYHVNAHMSRERSVARKSTAAWVGAAGACSAT